MGKSSSGKYGCPFCNASSPYLEAGDLYTLGDLLELNEVNKDIVKLSNSLLKLFRAANSPLKNQQLYQNCVNEPLITDQVDKLVIDILSIPELHLLIGIYIHLG